MTFKFERSSKFRPLRAPLQTLKEVCNPDQLCPKKIRDLLNEEKAQNRPTPEEFRPRANGQSYFNPEDFNLWLKSVLLSSN